MLLGLCFCQFCSCFRDSSVAQDMPAYVWGRPRIQAPRLTMVANPSAPPGGAGAKERRRQQQRALAQLVPLLMSLLTQLVRGEQSGVTSKILQTLSALVPTAPAQPSRTRNKPKAKAKPPRPTADAPVRRVQAEPIQPPASASPSVPKKPPPVQMKPPALRPGDWNAPVLPYPDLSTQGSFGPCCHTGADAEQADAAKVICESLKTPHSVTIVWRDPEGTTTAHMSVRANCAVSGSVCSALPDRMCHCLPSNAHRPWSPLSPRPRTLLVLCDSLYTKHTCLPTCGALQSAKALR